MCIPHVYVYMCMHKCVYTWEHVEQPCIAHILRRSHRFVLHCIALHIQKSHIKDSTAHYWSYWIYTKLLHRVLHYVDGVIWKKYIPFATPRLVYKHPLLPFFTVICIRCPPFVPRLLVGEIQDKVPNTWQILGQTGSENPITESIEPVCQGQWKLVFSFRLRAELEESFETHESEA